MKSLKGKSLRTIALISIAVLPVLFSGCGYNRMVTLEEGVDAAWHR
jgi:hypothetical protein